MVAPANRIPEVPSLRPEVRTRRLISCQDCHNNPDARSVGGSQVDGPHGSRFDHLLVARYETRDFTPESPEAYALCYRCHDRNSILNDESFALHRKHVVRDHAPCSACHTAHGVSGSWTEHGHLLNFDIAIVGGERFYQDTGRYRGACTLTCHGFTHFASGTKYPVAPGTGFSASQSFSPPASWPTCSQLRRPSTTPLRACSVELLSSSA